MDSSSRWAKSEHVALQNIRWNNCSQLQLVKHNAAYNRQSNSRLRDADDHRQINGNLLFHVILAIEGVHFVSFVAVKVQIIDHSFTIE